MIRNGETIMIMIMILKTTMILMIMLTRTTTTTKGMSIGTSTRIASSETMCNVRSAHFGRGARSEQSAERTLAETRGTQKKSDGPLRGWLVPRRPKKYQGWSDFFSRFFIVFLNSPHRETPKNVIKENREKIGLGFFCRFFCKKFSTRFFCQTFFVVFLNSHR